jgi:hypothetical protein
MTKKHITNLKNILSNDVEIRSWKAKSLPVDDFSIDNAIIMKKSKR